MPVGEFRQRSGQFVSETLMSAVQELEAVYNKYSKDLEFIAELNDFHENYTGRPSLLYYVEKTAKDLGRAKIYLEREDLNHTGSHKINNALGQVLLAEEMGKTHVIAETGAGQHGMAITTAAALLGTECEVFMGKEDTGRQALDVFRMQLLGARVHPVTNGTQTSKDAANETVREWTNRVEDTHCVLGFVMGPRPFPTIIRDLRSIIGREIREQLLKIERKLSSIVIAYVDGGSNAMEAFYEFINEPPVVLVGRETTGKDVETKRHAATICKGSLGIFHDMKSYFCRGEYGQIAPVYSISVGLDYLSIGSEHANLHDTDRISHVPATDNEAVGALQYLSRMEDTIPTIESARVVSYAREVAPGISKDDIIVINLSGRGDKDVAAIARYTGANIYEQSQ